MNLITKLLVSSAGISKNFSGLKAVTNSVTSNGSSLFFLFFLLVIFLVALTFGKTRIFLALLATYIAAFLESFFWYLPQLEKFFSNWLKLPASFWAASAVFIVFFVIAFLILNRSILKPKMSLQESPPFTILLLSILLGVFWLTILSSYLPAGEALISFSLAKKYLALRSTRFVVAVLPLLALWLMKRKRSLLE